MSEENDRGERLSAIGRELTDIISGRAPTFDEQGRNRYLLLLVERQRLLDEAEGKQGGGK